MTEYFSSVLLKILAFILVLGPLIFIHELGHFLMAKLLGIRVDVFSLGFGPRLFGFVWRQTEYRVALLPLGGYVKMMGENPDETRTGDPGEFLSRSKFERFLVLVMGATFNILLAIALVPLPSQLGVYEPLFLEQPVVIGAVQPDSPAQEAGLQPGDRIIEIDGEPVKTWKEFQIEVTLNPEAAWRLSVVRDDEIIDRRIRLGKTDTHRVGYAGIAPQVTPVITGVKEGTPAAAAGLQIGDLILSIDGETVRGPGQFTAMIQEHPGVPVEMGYSRDGVDLLTALTPAEVEGHGQVGVFVSPQAEIQRYGLVEAFRHSLRDNWENSGLLFISLRKLLLGELSIRAMSGPVEIFRISAASFQQGPVFFLGTIALLSLNLGIINLLPIPVLDGGHIFVILIEGLIRRDLSEKLKERLIQFGFLFLVTFMVIIIVFDVIKIGGY
jgi:regulator of sigma E protease